MRYVISNNSVTPVTAKGTVYGQSKGLELGPELAAGDMPSLRMSNEESSFTQFVRLNKSAAQRLRRSRTFSQGMMG